MKYWIWLAGVLILWGAMTAWLVREEVVPYFQYLEQPSYRTALADLDRPHYTRYRFEMRGDVIGHAESVARREENFHTLIESRVRLQSIEVTLREGAPPIPLPPVESSMSVWVDPAFRLSQFESETHVLQLPVRAAGRRVEERLEVSVVVGGVERRSDIEFPSDWMIGDGLMPIISTEDLEVGKKWSRRVLSIDLQGRVTFPLEYLSVEERSRATWNDTQVEAYVIYIRRDPTKDLPDARAFVLPDGRVFRQEFNLELVSFEAILEEDGPMSEGDLALWRRQAEGE